MVIRPQPGAQEKFLSSPADIVIYGGAAGGGKTYALLMEPLRHIHNSRFGAVIFRKNANQIFNEGGLWDSAFDLYPQVGARGAKTSPAMWKFPSGMKVSFAHIDYDKDLLSWQGSQITLVAFDELTHFSRHQFFYMLSRNRSLSGVRPYIRATTNPDADSWVAEFISWWIDQNTGYPIPERSGVLRYMCRVSSDKLLWGSSVRELVGQGCNPEHIKSVTFIHATLADNKILTEKDPGYEANLNALPYVERERLLGGNWKVRPAAGLYFKRARVNMLDAIPDDVTQWVRAWDMAATEDKQGRRPEDGPAYTAGVLIGKRSCGRYVVADVFNRRLNAADVRQSIRNTAVADRAKYHTVRIRLNQDPGQAGKDQAEQYMKFMSGFSVSIERETGSKETRAEPFSAQWLGVAGSERGNVDVLIADWNEEYFTQLEAFPEGKFKDMVDASSTAFAELERHAVMSVPGAEDTLAKESYWEM